MSTFEIAAVGAALCWALSAIISTAPSRTLGAFGFVRVRMALVFVMLAVAATATGGWSTLTADMAVPILMSGFVGIFIGDTALFSCMNRLGPRASGLLFATNAPFAVLLAWLLLDETLVPQALAGGALTVIGVALAIVYGRPRRDETSWLERVEGPLAIGVAVGLVAGLAQALGTLLARPVMVAGADPIAVSALRVAVAALALQAAASGGWKAARLAAPLDWRLVWQVAVSGLVAMGIGMTLLLYALEGGKVGIVSTLSATTPVLVLPMLWLASGVRPGSAAWLGAAVTVVGAGLIFLR